MGADFIVSTAAWPRNRRLDWEAGKRWIENHAVWLNTNWEGAEYADDICSVEEQDPELVAASVESVKQFALMELETLRAGIDGSYNDSTILTFGDWHIFLTGGSSWGEHTETGYSLDRLQDLPELMTAVGFGWPGWYGEQPKPVPHNGEDLPDKECPECGTMVPDLGE